MVKEMNICQYMYNKWKKKWMKWICIHIRKKKKVKKNWISQWPLPAWHKGQACTRLVVSPCQPLFVFSQQATSKANSCWAVIRGPLSSSLIQVTRFFKKKKILRGKWQSKWCNIDRRQSFYSLILSSSRVLLLELDHSSSM